MELSSVALGHVIGHDVAIASAMGPKPTRRLDGGNTPQNATGMGDGGDTLQNIAGATHGGTTTGTHDGGTTLHDTTGTQYGGDTSARTGTHNGGDATGTGTAKTHGVKRPHEGIIAMPAFTTPCSGRRPPSTTCSRFMFVAHVR